VPHLQLFLHGFAGELQLTEDDGAREGLEDGFVGLLQDVRADGGPDSVGTDEEGACGGGAVLEGDGHGIGGFGDGKRLFVPLDGDFGGEEFAEAQAVDAQAGRSGGVFDHELLAAREVVEDLAGEREGEEVAC